MKNLRLFGKLHQILQNKSLMPKTFRSILLFLCKINSKLGQQIENRLDRTTQNNVGWSFFACTSALVTYWIKATYLGNLLIYSLIIIFCYSFTLLRKYRMCFTREVTEPPFSHVQLMCVGHAFHMWNLKCDFSHVLFTCEISHVKFRM